MPRVGYQPLSGAGGEYGPPMVEAKPSDVTSKLPVFIRKNYELHEWRHATAILRTDFSGEWDDLVSLLTRFRLRHSAISKGGGRKSEVSGLIDAFLYEH